MKNKNLIAYAILAVCYGELLKHAQTWFKRFRDHYWVDLDNHTIAIFPNPSDTIEGSGGGYVMATHTEVQEVLLEWIKEWLDESEMVILHTDYSNGEISLHRPNDFTEDLTILSDPEFSELTHILYLDRL